MPSAQGDRILYNLKSEIKRKINAGSIETGKILVSNGKHSEEFEAETIPRTDILEDIFEGSQALQYTLYLNGQKTRKGLIPLQDRETEEEEQEIQPDNSENRDIGKIIQSQNAFLQQILSQQEILTQQKLDSMISISNMRIQAIEENFKKSIESREELFSLRLDLEREKAKLEFGAGQETILADTIQKVSDEVIPLIGEVAKIWIESKSQKNSVIKNMVKDL